MGDTHFVTLPDGRRVAYSDHGDPAGVPVLNCLGTPESRLIDPLEAADAARAGVRLISPDRPGFGQSDPQPGRRLEDWPADAAALLDALGLDRVGVLGGSGGGPYAVACGVLLADRITAVALAAPGPPRDAPEHGFVPREEGALRERGERMAALLREDPAKFFAFVAPDLSETDRQQEEGWDAETKARTGANFQEAFRQGADAYVEDHTINAGPWSHLLPRLTRPTRIWQGDDDNNVPATATKWMAARIPGAELTLVRGGHGLTDETWPEIFGWLRDHAGAPR